MVRSKADRAACSSTPCSWLSIRTREAIRPFRWSLARRPEKSAAKGQPGRGTNRVASGSLKSVESESSSVRSSARSPRNSHKPAVDPHAFALPGASHRLLCRGATDLPALSIPSSSWNYWPVALFNPNSALPRLKNYSRTPKTGQVGQAPNAVRFDSFFRSRDFGDIPPTRRPARLFCLRAICPP